MEKENACSILKIIPDCYFSVAVSLLKSSCQRFNQGKVCVTFCATATTVLTRGAVKRSLFHSAYT